jgi:hypothetical protein
MADSDKDLQIALLIRTELDKALADLRRFSSDAKNSLEETSKGAKLAEETFGKFEQLLAAFGIGFSVEKIVTGLRAIVNNAADAERSEGRLQAILDATGRGAEVSTDRLVNLSVKLAETTRFTESEAKDATATLLTFTNIASANFEQTLNVAAGLATVMNTDLRGATQQLGKALNDPVKQLESLSRTGITFTDTQEQMIAKMIRFGETAKAQQFILEELTKRGLGSAAAGENTGLYKATNDVGKSWSNMLEEFGRTPGVKSSVTSTLDFITGQLRSVRAVVNPTLDQQRVALTKLFLDANEALRQLDAVIAAGFGFGTDHAAAEQRVKDILSQIDAVDALIKKKNQAQLADEAAAAAAAQPKPLRIGDDTKKLLDEDERRIALLGQETEVQRTLAEIEKGKFKDLNPLEQQALLAIARRIDIATFETNAIKANTEAWHARNAELEQSAEKTRDLADPTRVMERELHAVNEQLGLGLLTDFEANVRSFDIKNSFGKITDGMKEVEKESDTFRDQMQRNLQSAFSEEIFNLINGKFQNLGQAFINMVERMAAELASKQILNQLSQMFPGFIGGSASPEANAVAGGTAPPPVTFSSGAANSQLQAFAAAPRPFSFSDLRSDEIPTLTRSRGPDFPNGLGNGGNVKVVVENKGTPIQAAGDAQVSFDPEGMVVRVITQDVGRGGPISSTLARAFSLRRKG